MTRTSRREMRDLLEIAGRRDVPARSETAQLIAPTVARAAAPSGSTSGDADELESRRARRRRLPAVLSGAAAAVVVLLVAGVLTGLFGSSPGDGDGRTDLALVTAVDTVVVLPDGSTIAGARGVTLPDGTIIRTGPRGRATVAGVRLGPDTEAVVRDGRVRVLDAAPGDVPEDGGAPGGETPAVPGDDTGQDGGSSGGTTSGGGSTGGTSSGDDGSAPGSSPPAPTAPPPVIVPPLPLPSLPSLDDVLPLG